VPFLQTRPHRYETCHKRLTHRWATDVAAYTFVITDRLSTLGAGPMTTAMQLPVLRQQLQSVSLQGVRTQHTATRFLGESAAEAARRFCASPDPATGMGLREEPFLGECLAVMVASLRLEGEVADHELAALRMQ